MIEYRTGRERPALPNVNDRAFRLQMRKVGKFPPLSMSGGYAAGAVAWIILEIARVALPWRFESRLDTWDWGGVVSPVLVITVAPLVFWILRARHFLIVSKSGQAYLAKKPWWNRLHDRHVLLVTNAAPIEFKDGDSWWRSATTVIGDEPYALFIQRWAVPRFRKMLSNPSASPPPLY